jgi:VanZ family protein
VISRFAPPLALMGLIFFLSAQPNLSSGLGDLDLVLRKCAHMAEYGVLALLWWRALQTESPWPGVAIAVAYAATDEFHQSFVEGRHGSPIDVGIDAIGMLGAIVLFRASRARWR